MSYSFLAFSSTSRIPVCWSFVSLLSLMYFRLLLGGNIMTNPDNILKSRDITLPTKVCLVKALVIPVVVYGCESWAIKKAEHWRIDAFELWWWRRLLRVSPLNSREIKSVNPRGNQSWLFIGRTDAKAEALILWLPDAKNWITEKDPDAGKDWDGWMASPTQWTWIWASSGRWWRTGKPGVLQFMGSQRVGHNWVTEQQQMTKIKIN